MPCTGRPGGGLRESDYIPKGETLIEKMKKRNDYLEAALCSVFSELERKGIITDVLNNAEKNGDINLMEFWSEHQQKDVERLNLELSKFSDHEKEVIKKILNGEAN